MRAFRVEDLPIESKMLTKALDEAQKKVENYFFDIRKQLFEYDPKRSCLYREKTSPWIWQSSVSSYWICWIDDGWHFRGKSYLNYASFCTFALPCNVKMRACDELGKHWLWFYKRQLGSRETDRQNSAVSEIFWSCAWCLDLFSYMQNLDCIPIVLSCLISIFSLSRHFWNLDQPVSSTMNQSLFSVSLMSTQIGLIMNQLS